MTTPDDDRVTSDGGGQAAEPLSAIFDRASGSSVDLTIPAGWEQGRGAYGGLVLGLLARSMERAVAAAGDEDRRLWTLNGEIPSPVVAGPARIEVHRIRRGNAVSAFEARLLQGEDGETRARASAILGAPRPVGETGVPTMEAPAGARPGVWKDLPVAPRAPFAPMFLQHFELRPTVGFPFSGANVAASEGWVAPRTPFTVLDAPELIALVDTYWPSLYPVAQEPRPMATVSFGFHRTGLAPRDPAAPVYYRSQALVSAGGFVYEQRELWSEDAELLALNPQTFAVIK